MFALSDARDLGNAQHHREVNNVGLLTVVNGTAGRVVGGGEDLLHPLALILINELHHGRGLIVDQHPGAAENLVVLEVGGVDHHIGITDFAENVP